MKTFPLTDRVIPAGRPVRHRHEDWVGKVAQFAHEKGMIMVIWDRGGGHYGASLAAYEDLEVEYAD